ncbi:MAG: pyridoxal phosphate-dependent aminotransferase [Pseudomonadota bacterium]|nr:pyridoxal phosphate-dependent aminotransferase [Pseudomonadota bacterium]
MTAKRIDNIQPFHVMALLARARELQAQGREVIHLEVGEPDFSTPQPVIDAGQRALAEGRTHYTPALGLPELREALSRWYREHFDIDVPAGRIVITPGSSTGLQMLMSALVDPGNKVLLPDPGYPCNRNFVYLCDAEPVSLAVSAQNGWIPSPRQIADSWDSATSLMMVASPANPTGAMLSRQQLEALVKQIRTLGGYLIVDEIYQGLSYETAPATALEFDAEHLFVVNSFSKYFGMTGWRLGWLVVPDSFVPIMDKLAQNIYLSAPTISQYAALQALQPESVAILEQRREEFHRRRDYLYPQLQQLGFKLSLPPQGAFYLYADCSDLCDDSFSFCHQLLEEQGVAVTPGRDFGNNRPQQHLRFAYTTSIEKMHKAVERIAGFL